MAKRKPKEAVKSDLITKYLTNKMFFSDSVTTRNIDEEIKVLNKLSKPADIETKLKNVDYQINVFLKNNK